MARIKVGDKIRDLKLPTIDGKTFDISEHKGKNIFISWLRFSGCPFCHLRVNELTNAEDKFGKDFANVAIFSCNVDALKKTATRHGKNIIVAADEDRKYFDKYDMPRSLARVSLGILISPLRMMRAVFKGYAAPSFNGAFNAVPVDVMINKKGIVEKVKYSAHTTDHIPVSEVIEFSNA
jgi:peroxiredoxin